MGKILNREDLKKTVEMWRLTKKKIVFTNGCFDLIHRGHIEYLAKARSYGDILIVGLNSDSSVKILKGNKRPFINEDDRAYILSNIVSVDVVSMFNEETPLKLIKMVIPDFLVKGGDYEMDQVVGREIVTETGGKVIIVPYIQGRSTSELIKKIREAY